MPGELKPDARCPVCGRDLVGLVDQTDRRGVLRTFYHYPTNHPRCIQVFTDHKEAQRERDALEMPKLRRVRGLKRREFERKLIKGETWYPTVPKDEAPAGRLYPRGHRVPRPRTIIYVGSASVKYKSNGIGSSCTKENFQKWIRKWDAKL